LLETIARYIDSSLGLIDEDVIFANMTTIDGI
jgi:hypothetical protein